MDRIVVNYMIPFGVIFGLLAILRFAGFWWLLGLTYIYGDLVWRAE